jgi:fatty acid amide hydrolase 2
LFQERLGDDAVVLFPTFPDVAHFHGEIYYKFLNVPYLLVFNSTEMPVTQCPIGLTSNGLPVGIQVRGEIEV